MWWINKNHSNEKPMRENDMIRKKMKNEIEENPAVIFIFLCWNVLYVCFNEVHSLIYFFSFYSNEWPNPAGLSFVRSFCLLLCNCYFCLKVSLSFLSFFFSLSIYINWILRMNFCFVGVVLLFQFKGFSN